MPLLELFIMANEKILIVDDEPDILELLRFNLSREGYQVFSAASGEEAANIAERVAYISKRPPVTVPVNYSLMAEKTEAMLKDSLDALVNLDPGQANRVRLADDEVDDIHVENYDKVKAAIKMQPERVGYLINLLQISRHLERIADHATNIAEEVIYMVEGVIHRHMKNGYHLK